MPLDNTARGGQATAALLAQTGSVYFAGICGVSMAGLAHMAHALGKRVRGCDRNAGGEDAAALRAAGIEVETDAEICLGDCGLVVYTAALDFDHPAICAAKDTGIPLCSRADFLAALMLPYNTRIAVAGMHGKSTTVGMLTEILLSAGLDPTVAGGAPLTPGGAAWRIGHGELFLTEACEYRDSFLSLSPTLSVVTNIELDHPDYFPNLDAVKHSFATFLSKSGQLVLGGDCPALCEIAPRDACLFGFGEHCRIRGSRGSSRMRVMEGDRICCELTLRVPGEYNRSNALAAIAAARALGIPFSVISDALGRFRGVGRRMEYAGEVRGARIYLDYAHHPTEIAAALRGAKESGGRVLCVFQPHTYTRTKALWGAFIDALHLADHTILTDIYAAREQPIPGVTSQELARQAGVEYAANLKEAAQRLRRLANSGDIILIMGAGDVNTILPCLTE
jgi:UDP-N-acetylmuramate--alanine ligase